MRWRLRPLATTPSVEMASSSTETIRGTTHPPDASFCPETSVTRYPTAEILPLKSYSKNRNYVVILAAFCLVFVRAGAAGEMRHAITAEGIERDIKADGAASVVKKLTSGKGDQWQVVVRKVETGSPAWLHVAHELLTATHAGNTNSLYF